VCDRHWLHTRVIETHDVILEIGSSSGHHALATNVFAQLDTNLTSL